MSLLTEMTVHHNPAGKCCAAGWARRPGARQPTLCMLFGGMWLSQAWAAPKLFELNSC